MCGIAGFTRFYRSPGDESTLMRMGEAIRHRGPDATGSYLDEHIGLHHRRLAIVDLSDSGNQPMHSSCGRYVIVFNGEIYNFLELRNDLLERGVTFRTKTDTEVILQLFSMHGVDCLAKLNGMFAFALWDREEQRLFIARDRIGKKPLYYSIVDGDIVFASELKAILSAELVPKDVRMDAIYDFFAYQYIPDPKTIFKNVYKLEPGHYLSIDANSQRNEQYWDLSFAPTNLNGRDAKAELSEHIDASTRRRMIADVPLGAFLSGGVDSSGIVARMAHNSETPITTCAIGFDEERFNETEFARTVADRYATDHHEYTVSENVAEVLREVAHFFDEPFADASLVPTFFVAKLARQRVTVALSGDGGDEVFAGYEKYSVDAIENRWRRRIPKALRKSLLPHLSRGLRGSRISTLRRAGTLFGALEQEPAMGFYLSNAQITDEQWDRLCATSLKEKLGSYHPSEVTLAAYANCDGEDHLSRILYTDMKTYLPGDILVKMDRMSMAHSLEVRAPLLDYQLVEFSAALPSSLKLRNDKKKFILKETFRPDLPDTILDRKKMGFSPPLAAWFRDELRALAFSALFESTEGLCHVFKPTAVRQFWDEHQSGHFDHGAVLWSMLMFQLWWDAYMTDDRVTDPGASNAQAA